ncbi:DUF4845 domain-containing protein [Dokdonella immobilis]|uniref:DUF4845 domain-containing protein n=1 Tax=Dokdonella immobilis TaxID=578942 RepID=A0A1I4VWG2_9GAMM|nr:DUF4845 domain-containing protein [Dokdonella immobilis]SFN05542.1 protein of unknown function [Dokdonella immobilis]
MSIRNRSRGITFIGFLVVLVVVGFFVYLGMRLVPMYIEYMGVVKSMEQVRSEPGAGNMSPEQVRRSLQFKFDAQYVESGAIPPEAIQVIRQGNAQTLRIRYERRVPFIHNLEILGTFDKSVNLSGADD